MMRVGSRNYWITRLLLYAILAAIAVYLHNGFKSVLSGLGWRSTWGATDTHDWLVFWLVVFITGATVDIFAARFRRS